jgi:hypothetical protein
MRYNVKTEFGRKIHSATFNDGHFSTLCDYYYQEMTIANKPVNCAVCLEKLDKIAEISNSQNGVMSSQ